MDRSPSQEEPIAGRILDEAPYGVDSLVSSILDEDEESAHSEEPQPGNLVDEEEEAEHHEEQLVRNILDETEGALSNEEPHQATSRPGPFENENWSCRPATWSSRTVETWIGPPGIKLESGWPEAPRDGTPSQQPLESASQNVSQAGAVSNLPGTEGAEGRSGSISVVEKGVSGAKPEVAFCAPALVAGKSQESDQEAWPTLVVTKPPTSQAVDAVQHTNASQSQPPAAAASTAAGAQAMETIDESREVHHVSSTYPTTSATAAAPIIVGAARQQQAATSSQPATITTDELVPALSMPSVQRLPRTQSTRKSKTFKPIDQSLLNFSQTKGQRTPSTPTSRGAKEEVSKGEGDANPGEQRTTRPSPPPPPPPPPPPQCSWLGSGGGGTV